GWVEIARFGRYPDAHLKVYAVSSANAIENLAAARVMVGKSKTPAALRQLLAAAAAAGEFCEASGAWQGLRVMDPETVKDFDPLPIIRECLAVRPQLVGENQFYNG